MDRPISVVEARMLPASFFCKRRLGYLLLVLSFPLRADVLFFSGNLETNATVTDCGAGCKLNPIVNTQADYAQWAAAVYTFQVTTKTQMEAITYSFGGGTSMTGAAVAPGGFSPYLSLFDGSGNFLDSTFNGTDCPPGAHSFGGSCDDVLLNGGTLLPGTYQIALTAFENMSLAENLGTGKLADGFTGLGNFDGNTLSYAFDVILPQQTKTTTPEPGTFGVVCVCAALMFLKRVLHRIKTRRM
ncbi:MAG: DVUA0089 family protein [Acidobacteriaceae bacterium]|nr:DVUA0089 family protein [Acidobacteriaceae bacterium]